MRRTVFVCAKVARGRAAIAQSTCLAALQKSAQKTKKKPKTAKQTLQADSPQQHEAKETKTKAIEALEKELFTFSAVKPKT